MPDWTYHPFFRPLLFRLSPEEGRQITLGLLSLQARTAAGRRLFRFFGHGIPPAALAVRAFGIDFPAPIGLAAGIDTSAVALSVLQYLGLGFLCVGPAGCAPVARRVATDPLRIREKLAIVRTDRAAAPSVSDLDARIRQSAALAVPAGIALSARTCDEAAEALQTLDAGGPAARFFVLSSACVSEAEIEALRRLRAASPRPLLVKLSPDWPDRAIDEAVERAIEAGIDGCVASAGAACPLLPDGELMAPAVRARALAITERIARRHGDAFPVVGAGGVMSPEDALSFLDAGATLVELYEGLIYAGPGLPGRIVHVLERSKVPMGSAQAEPRDDLLLRTAGSGAAADDGGSARTSRAAPPYPRGFARRGEGARAPSLGGLGPWLLGGTGGVLVASGIAALVLAATVQFLPHDFEFLGMTAEALCAKNACRIVHFMVHDRVSWGGSMISIGTLYLWLARSPLRAGKAWAFWVFVISGAIGFASFLTYVGYGYLDVWHGRATLALLIVFVAGLVLSYGTLERPRGIGSVLRPGARAWLWSPAGMGRAAMTFTAAGMILGGLTIMIVGMTRVFVPQDLEYMGVTVEELRAINPRLIPLIAHDRAGFGGGLCSGGVAVLLSLWCGARPRSPGLWFALTIAGFVGFVCAIGIHPIVGYTSFTHLFPAYVGALSWAVAIALLYRPMSCADEASDRFPDLG